MQPDFLQLANQGIQGLSPYQPGKPIEELARELKLDPQDIVKLASNENPLGPSPQVVAAIQAALPDLCLYPDGSGFQLKADLAVKFNLQPEQITLGNGSNDLLDLIGRCWLELGRKAVYSQYAFAVYPITTQAQGAIHQEVPAKNWGHDLPAMLQAIDAQTSVVFLANPNNPTGTWFEEPELLSFLRQVPPQVLVVLDEAYIEFVDQPNFPNSFKLLEEFPNLIVCRTLAKAYGLAGLRVGYSVSSPAIAAVLNRIRQPFNVNSLALVAASAALHDDAYLAQSLANNQAAKQQLEAAFKKLGLSYIPSLGNFICLEVGDAAAVNQALLAEGIIVRPLAPYAMPKHLRISLGLPAENERLIQALEKIFAQ